MQTIHEEKFKDIHYDILENFHKCKDFQEVLDKKGQYCLNLENIKNSSINNLSKKYSDDEIELAINEICKTQYLDENDGLYCTPKSVYRLNLGESY